MRNTSFASTVSLPLNYRLEKLLRLLLLIEHFYVIAEEVPELALVETKKSL